MNSLEKELLWNGYEDYTGLWDAFFAVRDEFPERRSAPEAQDVARQIIGSFLDRGWVELYISRGPVGDYVYDLVPQEDQPRVLDSETSWSWEDGDPLVWYATTDEGYFAYQEANVLPS